MKLSKIKFCLGRVGVPRKYIDRIANIILEASQKDRSVKGALEAEIQNNHYAIQKILDFLKKELEGARVSSDIANPLIANYNFNPMIFKEVINVSKTQKQSIGGESIREDENSGRIGGYGSTSLEKGVPRGTARQRPAKHSDKRYASREEGPSGTGRKNIKGRKPESRRGGSDQELHTKTSSADKNREARLKKNPTRIPKTNFDLHKVKNLGKGSINKKFIDNIEAIRLLKQLEKEGRQATPKEQAILAKYVGWGGMPQAFRNPQTGEYSKGWEEKAKELESILTEEELEAARSSTRNAHYTSPAVINGIWNTLSRLGLKEGLALEPTLGVGHFIGLLPQNMKGNVHFVGTELDSISARLASHLYPQEAIFSNGFERTAIPTGTFDVVVGNPPFGKESLAMKYFPEFNRFSIHNQILLSSMKALKPGGVMAVVVSRYFMDSKDASARMAMNNMAHFIGAVRLPDMAFKENANTEVVTDILFFVRRDPSETVVEEKSGWIEVTEVPDPLGGEPMTVNKYFADNPNQIVGRLERSGKMYAKKTVNVKLEHPGEFNARLLKTLNNIALPEGVTAFKDVSPSEKAKRQQRVVKRAIRLALQNKEQGHIGFNSKGELEQIYEITTEDGNISLAVRTIRPGMPWSPNIYYDSEGRFFRLVPKTDKNGKRIKEGNRLVYQKEYFDSEEDLSPGMRLSKNLYQRLKDAIAIRDVLYKQIKLEAENRDKKAIEENRKKLNKLYDAFVKEHGYMNDPATKKVIGYMPDRAMLYSLEKKYKKAITPSLAKKYGTKTRPAKAEKADIFFRKVIQTYSPPERVEQASDAVAISLAEYGRIDLERIASLLDTDEEGVIKQLHDDLEKPLIFRDVERGEWVTYDEYLSGNVVRKLEAAIEAGLEKNIKTLEAVQPEPWTSDKITPILGASWIPDSVYSDFYRHLTGVEDASIKYLPISNKFHISHQKEAGGKAIQWQTERLTAGQILSKILNSQKIVVKDTYIDDYGNKRSIINPEATEEANQKAQEMREEFMGWAFRDSDRRRRLTKIFNDKYNVLVLRQRDGSHLKFPGKVPDEVIKLRHHQVNGVWRGITDKVVLYDHVVGSGKTMTSIARVMERKRMGLAKKPMIAVPNHIVEQFATEFQMLYPGAKILVATEKDTQKAKRQLFFAKIANNEWDAIVIPHSMFERINLSPEKEEEFLKEDIAKAADAVAEAEAMAEEEGWQGRGKHPSVKSAEAVLTKLENRLKKIRDKSAKGERFISFEQMGIDDLVVDEAHLFKNLFYQSSLQVKGMNTPTGSQRALDLFNKTRYLHQIKGGIAFLTGTPISNSAVEMYNLMRYMIPKELEEAGLEHFDAFRSQFVSITTQLEPTESGRGLKTVERLGVEWYNMRSLMNMYYSFADSVTNEDIIRWYEENTGERYPIPKVKGGGRQTVAVEPTEATEEIMQQIVAGFDSLQDISDPIERAAERFRLMDKARKVSLDPRLIDPVLYKGHKGGKLDKVADEVKRIYDEWSEDKGTQLVFLDRGVKATSDDIKRLRKYEQLNRELEAAIKAGDIEGAQKIENKLEAYNPDEMQAIKMSADLKWNAYDEIKANLIERGIPANEIAYIHDANTPQQKQQLFDAVNEGAIRVLIGSTAKMGAGTNVQERLVALHHVDVGWKPSDIEQREGRIIRQGNKLYERDPEGFEVEILAYVTKTTVDAKMWDLNSQKLRMINALRNYNGEFTMEFVDEDAIGLAEIAAEASGEPLQVERVKLEAEVERLIRQKRAFLRSVYAAQDSYEEAKEIIAKYPEEIKRVESAVNFVSRVASARHEKSLNARNVNLDGTDFDYEDLHRALQYIEDVWGEAKEKGEKASITIDGKTVKSKVKAVDSVRDKLGDERWFNVEYEGKPYIRRIRLGQALLEKIKKVELNENGEAYIDKFAELTTETGKIIISLEASNTEVLFHVATYLQEGPKNFSKIHDQVKLLAGDIKGINALKKVRAKDITLALMGLKDASVPAITSTLARMEAKLEEAKKNIDEYKKAAERSWPKEAELEEKQNRLQEVRALLNEDSSSEIPKKSAHKQIPKNLQADVEEELKSWLGSEGFKQLTAKGHVKIVTRAEARDIFNLAGVRGEDEPVSLTSPDGLTVQGFYWNDTVYLVQGAIAKGDTKRIILHELAVHAKQLGFASDKAYKKLLDELQERAINDDRIKEAFQMVPADTPPEHIQEEALAYLIQTGKTDIGIVRKILAHIKKWLVEKLGISPSIFTPDDLSALAITLVKPTKIKSGPALDSQKKLFEVVAPPQDRTSLYSVNRFKPVTRETLNSPEFKRWFGDSKIKRRGKPLKMYHGSNVTIWRFDPARLGASTGHTTSYLGFFFTPSKKQANHYGDEVTSVYLKVEKPFITTAETLADKVTSPAKAKALRKLLEQKGYDGIILKEQGHVVVFRPEQIKSAELNTGEFLPNNPDIRFSKSRTIPVTDNVASQAQEIASTAKELVEDAKAVFKQFNPLAEDKYTMPGPVDTNLLDRLFALPSHYFEKVPALKRVYEAAIAGREFYAEYVDAMAREKDGSYRTQKITEFEKKNPREFKKLCNYLVEKDAKMWGWRVKRNPESGKWMVFAPHKKGATAILDTEGEAWREAIKQEAEYLKSLGYSDDAAEALKAFRATTHAGFEILTRQLKAIIAEYEKKGLKLEPNVTLTDAEGNTFQGTLKDALAMMGDLRGFYFPRIHKPGAYIVYAISPTGEHRIFKYDIKKLGEAKVASLRSKGWQAELAPSSQLPESVFDMSKNVLNAQAIITVAMERIKEADLNDIPGLDIKRDGEDLKIVGPASKTLNKIFKSFGGRFYNSDNAWHFRKIGKRDEKRLRKSIIAWQQKIDSEVHAAYLGMINEQVANIFKARGGRARMIRRNKKVVWKGYEENASVALTQYISGIAATEAKKNMAMDMLLAFTGQDISWDEFQEAWTTGTLGTSLIARDKAQDVLAFRETLKEDKEAPDYLDYIHFQRQRMVHPVKQKNAYEDGKKYMAAVLRNKEAADRVFGILAGMAMIKYLGLRPSSVFVNVTAMLTNAPAAIAGYSGKSLNQSAVFIGNAYTSFYKFWKYKKTGKRLPGLSEDDIRAYDYMERKGWVQDQFNREAMSALYGKLGNAYRRLTEKVMWGFKVSEQLNRYATIKAAYDAVKDLPEFQGDFEAAMRRAREISDKAHGVYGKINQPHYVQNIRFLQALYVFQTFIHNYWNTLYDLGVSKKAIMPAIYLAVSPAILAGTTVGASGLVVKAIFAAIKKAFGIDDPEEEYYNWLYNTFGIAGPAMATLARQGIFGLAGVDLSGSLEATPRAPKKVTDWLGAPGAVVVDFVRGSKLLWRGDISKGFERILPIAFAQLFKSYREYKEGVTRLNNAPVFDQFGRPLKLDALEALFEAAGFNPARKAKERQIDWHKRRVKAEYAEKRSYIYSRLRKAFLEYNGVLPDNVWAEFVKLIEEYNERAMKSGGEIPVITKTSIKRALTQMYSRR